VPIDWPHTLSAIYQVRCNLFHGYKGVYSENDISIVSKEPLRRCLILQRRWDFR